MDGRRVRILFVNAALPNRDFDGVGDYADRLYEALTQRRSIRLKRLRFRRTGFLQWVAFSRRIIRWRFVIHLQYPQEAWGWSVWPSTVLPIWYAIFVGRRNKPGLMVTCHEWRQMQWLRRLAAVPLILFADEVVVPTDRIRRDLEKLRACVRRAPNTVTKISVGNNLNRKSIPSNHTQREQKKGPNGSANRPVRLCSFGFVHKSRKLEQIVEAVEKVRQATTVDVVLDVYGGRLAGHEKYFEKVVSESQDRAWLTVHGYIGDEQLTEELGSCAGAIQLYPDGASARRGSLIAVLEAGLPVVTNIGPESRELLAVKVVESLFKKGHIRLVGCEVAQAELVDEIQELVDRIVTMDIERTRVEITPWSEIASRYEAVYRRCGT